MLTLVEALHFRCLRYIDRPLRPFQVLVGPNGTGKTTFLDIVGFLGDLVSNDLDAALANRTPDVRDLLWGRQGTDFELAVEARIPPELQGDSNAGWHTARYEVRIGFSDVTNEVSILEERVLLRKGTVLAPTFPGFVAPRTKFVRRRQRDERTTVRKVPNGNDNFYSEVFGKPGKGWVPSVRFGPRRSALRNLPADERKFPITIWLRNLLSGGVQTFVLNSKEMRKPSPPGQGLGFKPDGSNLPWVVETLITKDPSRYQEWIRHLQTAIPDLESVRTVLKPEDMHRYLMVCYQGGLEVPSWMTSDGTLRLLALTLPAYLPDLQGVLLIEEPENGIHPRAVETVVQSLSSVYRAQVLLATHSPVLLSVVQPEDVLCFAKTEDGATDIVSGAEHPALREWRGETDLGTLFASGVLG